jgi:hypothetical protein
MAMTKIVHLFPTSGVFIYAGLARYMAGYVSIVIVSIANPRR